MADQVIAPVSVPVNKTTDAVTGVSLTAANDGVITPVSDKMVVILYDAGGAGGTVLIKAGTEGALSGQGDITVTLGAGETKAICVESARVKALSGTDKGKIRLDASANTTAWAYAL